MKSKRSFILILCFALCVAGAIGRAEDTGASFLGRLGGIKSAGEKVVEALNAIRGAVGTASIDDLFEMRNLIDEELGKRGFALNATASESSVDRDFPDVAVCAGRISGIDSIVAFGDSIFAGYTIPNEHGVVQQLAESLNVPLYCYAEPGATLTTKQDSPKNVVQQVYDYQPVPGTVPLILIDGGTNDQYHYNLSNLGVYGSDDTTTIYGATLTIIQNLLSKGIEPWQIVFTTPIPRGIQNDAEFRARIDTQLTTTGLAIFQVGAAMGCNVINGYHSIFEYMDIYELKAILMPDDTHPSETGAAYYAGFIRRILS